MHVQNQYQVPHDVIDTDRSAWIDTDRSAWTVSLCRRFVLRDRGDRIQTMRAQLLSKIQGVSQQGAPGE
jgi:hypothetical protein